MGFESIPGTDLTYGLISYDTDGHERAEGPGLMSRALLQKVAAESATDVFFFCHGWKGDVPAAKEQYASWMGALLRSADRQAAPQKLPGFKPLLIGLHWPSLPWGDEELKTGSFAAAGGGEALLAAYLERLGNAPEIRKPLEVIFDEARHNAAPDKLPAPVRQAYLDLNRALGLRSEGVDAPPDADREEFDPDVGFDGGDQPAAFGGDLDLGGLLGPLRQLSYWTMKKRARTIGEGGMHDFLVALQQAAPNLRIHLMGHSFGTIVVSSMVGGPQAKAILPRPVHSLALVQGAVSLWCYAAEIPFGNGGTGYFNGVLASGKVRGPLVSTRSKHDSAVGVMYPLASRFSGSAKFAELFPEFGAIGAYGIQGLAPGAGNNLTMLGANGAYAFDKGKVYNLDGSQFIAKGDGISGAHSDIAGPEVAHVLWAAAFASM